MYMRVNTIVASLWTSRDCSRRSAAPNCIILRLLLIVGLVGVCCCGRGRDAERGVIVFWSSARLCTRGGVWWSRAVWLRTVAIPAVPL